MAGRCIKIIFLFYFVVVSWFGNKLESLKGQIELSLTAWKSCLENLGGNAENESPAKGYCQSLVVGDSYAAYLDLSGKVHVIYSFNDSVKAFDYDKTYVDLVKQDRWLTAIDADGRVVTACPDTADTIEEQIENALKTAMEAGGTYGCGGPDAHSVRELEDMTDVCQVFVDYAYDYCVLLQNGIVLYHPHGLRQRLVDALEGSVQIARKNSTGEIVGLREDGTLAVFANSERPQDDLQRWTKLKDLQQWTKLKQICAGDSFVGLTVDGKVIAELGVLRYRLSKENWEDIQEIAVAKGTVVGLKNDGTVVAVCSDEDNGQCDVTDWKNVVAVDTNGNVTVGIDREGKVFITGMDW